MDATNGRAANGQFLPGNPGGPGRRKRQVEAEYLAAIAQVVTLEEWQAIIARAKVDALLGDRHARAWLGNYLVGRAPELEEWDFVGQTVESGPSINEIRKMILEEDGYLDYLQQKAMAEDGFSPERIAAVASRPVAKPQT